MQLRRFRHVSLPKLDLSRTYKQPAYLDDIFLLDILELSGSQHAAATFLEINQSTISRSLSRAREELELQSAMGRSGVCRNGTNPCLDFLRLAARAHRMMKGFIRIGADPLHQSLLSYLNCVDRVPCRFHKGSRWIDYIRHGLLDGAIVSSLSMDANPLSKLPRDVNDLEVLSLGQVPLYLMSNAAAVSGVLVPGRAVSPGLHHLLEQDGIDLTTQPRVAHSPNAWLKRMRDRDLALPLSPALTGQAWLKKHGLSPLPDHSPIHEQLWLVVARSDNLAIDIHRQVDVMRRRLRRAK